MQKSKVLLVGNGFLGKVILEELLRKSEQLQIEQIFVLMRAATNDEARLRLQEEIWNCPGWEHVSEQSKSLVESVPWQPLAEGGGLSSSSLELFQHNVTHIIYSLASWREELPFYQTLQINAGILWQLTKQAHSFTNLKNFAYVSTAFVHPPPTYEQAPEKLVPLEHNPETLYHKVQQTKPQHSPLVSHPKGYLASHVIAEHLFIKEANQAHFVPLIFRPTILANAFAHPSAGWADREVGYMRYSYLLANGLVKGCWYGNHRANVVPVDWVASSIVKQTLAEQTQAQVWQLALQSQDQLTYQELFRKIIRYFRSCAPLQSPKYLYSRKGLHYLIVHLCAEKLPLFLKEMYFRYWKRDLDKATFLRQLAHDMTSIHHSYAFFLQHNWNFQTSLAYSSQDLQHFYQRGIPQGCLEFLLKEEISDFTIAGREHVAMESDWAWMRQRKHANWTIRLMGYTLRKVFRRCFSEVTVDLRSFPSQNPQDAYIIIPTHRSYFDFLLTCYIFYDRPELGIKMPYIAGSEDFFKLPIIGWLFKNAHCFPVRRNRGKEDPELTGMVHDLLERRENLKFYIEGTRSRSRQFLPPKRGLLRCIQKTQHTFEILPISISYEKIAEEATFYQEIRSGVKPKMSLKALLRWSVKLFLGQIHLGRVHIQAGKLIPFGPQNDLHQVVRALMHELQNNKVATEYHKLPSSSLRKQIPQKNSSVVPTTEEPLARWCYQNQWIHYFFPFERSGNPWIQGYISEWTYQKDLPHIESSDEQIQRVLEEYFRPLLYDLYYICQHLSEHSQATRQELLAAYPLHLGSISVDFAFRFLTQQGYLQRQDKKYQLCQPLDEKLWNALASTEKKRKEERGWA